jgi:hypothetical protein
MTWGHPHLPDHEHHAEETRRHRIWWASLTEDQKRLEVERQKCADLWFTCTLGVTGLLVLAFASLVYFGVFHNGLVERILAFVAFPASLFLAGALALYKRSRVN